MKKILGALLALTASIAFGATTVPVQLLNPTGSSSGQAIVSTGASSAPAWGGIGVNGIAAIAANTVLANATGSSASPTAFAMPSCTGAANALEWTSGTGFQCNSAINAAQLGGQTFTGSPTITTPNIVGVTNGGAASAGSVGQIITATATAVSLTTGTPANGTSISLTAGQWDVYGACRFIAAGSTIVSNVFAGANTTSATFPASPLFAVWQTSSPSSFTGAALSLTIPPQPFNVSTTTTIYLVVQAGFATSTETVDCNLWGERRR